MDRVNYKPTNDRPITGNLPRMTFCYERRPTDYSAYYVPNDNPRVHGPLDHRPTWKGAESNPRQAPSTLVETSAHDRPALEHGGFLPHHGEFTHYAGAVDNESSLRNLDQPLSERAFGQRVLLPQASLPKSHVEMRVVANDACQPSGNMYRSDNPGAPCGLERKYDESLEMNSARFNNSTRLTTKNLVLPIVEPSADWKPQEAGRIGNVPVRRP
jgi:hypothetical protein